MGARGQSSPCCLWQRGATATAEARRPGAMLLVRPHPQQASLHPGVAVSGLGEA